MALYTVITPLRNGGPEPLAPGAPVDLDKDEGDALVAIGALSPAVEPTPSPPPPAPVGPTPPPAPPAPPREATPPAAHAKPLSSMKRPELAAEAEKAGVTVAIGMTNKQVVAAIEAKRVGGAS